MGCWLLGSGYGATNDEASDVPRARKLKMILRTPTFSVIIRAFRLMELAFSSIFPTKMYHDEEIDKVQQK
jgi:hypothetical protein